MVAAGVRRARIAYWKLGLAALVAGWVGSASAAPIVWTIAPADSIGVDVALGCTSASCSAASQVFTQSGSPDEVFGSFTIDTVALTLSFNLSSAVQHTGSANGVTALNFDPISYVSNGNLALTSVGGGQYSINGTLGPTATVSGTLVENGGTVGPFSAPSVRVTGTCDVVGASSICGFTFGGIGFQVGVGNPDQSLSFRHTMNLFAVPEPGSALLLGFAVASLALVRRGQGS